MIRPPVSSVGWLRPPCSHGVSRADDDNFRHHARWTPQPGSLRNYTHHSPAQNLGGSSENCVTQYQAASSADPQKPGGCTCWNPSSSGSLSNKSPLSLTSAPVSPSRVRFSLWRCRTRELSCKSTGGSTKRSPKPLIATRVLLNSSFSKSLPEVSTACCPGLQSKHSFHALSPRLSGWSRVCGPWSQTRDLVTSSTTDQHGDLRQDPYPRYASAHSPVTCGCWHCED